MKLVQDVENPHAGEAVQDPEEYYSNDVKKEEDDEDHFKLPAYLIGLEGLVLDTESLKIDWARVKIEFHNVDPVSK